MIPCTYHMKQVDDELLYIETDNIQMEMTHYQHSKRTKVWIKTKETGQTIELEFRDGKLVI